MLHDRRLPNNQLCPITQLNDYNGLLLCQPIFWLLSFEECNLNQVRGVVSLFVVSYLIHAMLLVNSAESELHNAQKSVGNLLVEQLANSAAPLIMNKDSVGLGLLANQIGDTPAILSLRIINSRHEVIATGGNAPSQSGHIFRTPIELEKQTLGDAEIILTTPARGDIIRDSIVNLLLSLLIHVFMAAWIGWPQLFQGRFRIPILQALPEPVQAVAVAPVSTPPTPAPEPVKAAASVFLQFCFDDRKNLMQKVNVSTAEQLLFIVDKLLRRAVRLHSGKVIQSLNADGASVRFDGDHIDDCMARALACGRLFLKLTDSAYQHRRQAKQFALRMKVGGVELAELTDDIALLQAQRLAKLATVNQFMLTASESAMTTLQAKHQFSAFEAEEGSENADIKAHVLVSLDEKLEEELTALEKRILERKKPNENA